MNAFRIILYQQCDGRWHYVRLTAESGSELRTAIDYSGTPGPGWRPLRSFAAVSTNRVEQLSVASGEAKQFYRLRTETGVCGLMPDHTEAVALADDADAKAALNEAGKAWQAKGWNKPAPAEVLVLTLHFQMRRWTGYPASAPWPADLTAGYLDPVLLALESSCNGLPRGIDRFSGYYL